MVAKGPLVYVWHIQCYMYCVNYLPIGTVGMTGVKS